MIGETPASRRSRRKARITNMGGGMPVLAEMFGKTPSVVKKSVRCSDLHTVPDRVPTIH